MLRLNAKGTHRWAALAGASALGLLIAAPASAHVTANPREAAANGYTKHDFRVGHGCDGSPTTKVAIQIPDGVISVKPQVVPGWTIAVTKGPITPYESEGQTISEGVKEVSWTGGPLPDEHMLEFGLSMKMPDKEGETLYFPTVQTCQQGEHRWITIPVEGQEEPDEPAPAIKLTAAAPEHGSAGAKDASGGSEEQAGAIQDEAASASGSSGTDGLTIIALILAIAGVLLGGGALGMAARRRNP
jgi:uncharacterized protein YcnI